MQAPPFAYTLRSRNKESAALFIEPGVYRLGPGQEVVLTSLVLLGRGRLCPAQGGSCYRQGSS